MSDRILHLDGSFTGKTTEYFKIYIVNLILTILTLGLYYPWAKIRRKRYLYGHLHLGKYGFDFHAKPWPMLRAMLLLYFILILYFGISFYFTEQAQDIKKYFITLSMMLLPWIYNNALRFNARMTSFANIRFDFDGDYFITCAFLYLGPIISVLTLLFATPYIDRKFKSYLIGRHKWGQISLQTDIPHKPVFAPFFLLVQLPLFLLLALCAFIYLNLDDILPEVLLLTLPILLQIGILILVLYQMKLRLALSLYNGLMEKLALSHMTCDLSEDMQQTTDSKPQTPKPKLEVTYRVLHLVWLQFIGYYLKIISLSLLKPYMDIRILRYKISYISLSIPEKTLQENQSYSLSQQASFAEMASDIYNIDTSL